MSLQRLDVLQSMVNAILLETGRALRATNKGAGTTQPSSNNRLRSSIPGAIDNFHQALDDLEADIIRAKAVLHRDLEELRAKRFEAEKPPIPEVFPTVMEEESPKLKEAAGEIQLNSQPTIKQENVAPEAPMIAQDAPKEVISTESATKVPQAPSPPSSNDIKQEPARPKLEIETAASHDASPTGAGGLPGSAIDSLFGTTESLDVVADSDLTFEAMDFLDSSNTHDNSQPQNTEFDLSTFGNNTSDFNMTDLEIFNEPGNKISKAASDQDDLFGMTTTGGPDLMDLDATMRPAEESSFDDLFFIGEDSGMGGGGSTEMEHGVFDDSYFNLD